MIGTFLIFPISWFCIIFAVAVIIVIAVIAVITAAVNDANVVIVSLILG